MTERATSAFGVAGVRASRARLLGGAALQAAALLLLTLPARAQPAPNARPIGGQVVAGSAAIIQAPHATTVDQASQRAAIDWRGFDVGSQQSVTFQQPSSTAVTLNRVTGPDPSQIAGRISANGQVVLVNQSGVTFSRGSQVETAGLVVSSAGIGNRNFMAGRMVFDQAGKPDARISNAGTITVRQAGLAALVAPQVANSGVISAKLGHVVMAGAETHTLDLYGDGLLSFNVTGQVKTTPKGPDGNPVTALVTNTGTITAKGGTVLLTAEAADGVVQTLVNAGGRIAANGTASRTGTVVMRGVGGAVVVEGDLSAAGERANTSGGAIELNATGEVRVASGARVNASGRAGGGTIAVGTTLARARDPSASATLTARRVTVESGAIIAADATVKGNGGRVALLSTDRTDHSGAITARGGPKGGNGGFAEVSGDTGLSLTGTIDLGAPLGPAGTVLLDPQDLTIFDTPPNGATVLAPAAGALAPQVKFTDAGSATDAWITPATIQGLTAGTVELQATRDLSVLSAVTLTQPHQNLTLDAGRNLTVNAALSAPGAVALNAASGGVFVNAPVSGASIPLAGGTGISIAAQGALTATGATSLSAASGDITASGAISAGSLAASAPSGSIALNGANVVPVLGPATASGSFALVNNGPLTIGSAISASAIQISNSGAIAQAAGAITTNGSPGGVAIASIGPASSFVQSAGASILSAGAAGAVTLQADAISLAGTTTATTVAIAPATGLALNVVTVPVVGTLSLAPASLSTVTAATLDLGRAGNTATATNLTIDAGLIRPNTSTLGLYSTGPITQAAPIAVGTLTGAGLSFDLTNAGNSIGTLGALSSSAGALAVTNGTAVIVGGPLSAAGSTILLRSDAGVRINAAVTAQTVRLAPVTNTVAMTLDAVRGGGFSLLPSDLSHITGTARLDLGSANGTTANAASITVNTPITSPAATLALFANGAVTETGTSTVSAGTLVGSSTGLSFGNANAIPGLGGYNAGSGSLVLNTAGALTVAGANSGATVALTAGGALTQASGAITASAAGSIGTPSVSIRSLGGSVAQTAGATITATDPAGTIVVDAATDANTGSLSGGAVSISAGHDAMTSGSVTAGNDVTIFAGNDAVTSGSVQAGTSVAIAALHDTDTSGTVIANGGSTTISAQTDSRNSGFIQGFGVGVEAVNGNLTQTAGTIQSSANGDAQILAPHGTITQSSGATISAPSHDTVLSSHGDISFSGLIEAGQTVTLGSAAGGIAEHLPGGRINSAFLALQAPSDITLDTPSPLGSGNLVQALSSATTNGSLALQDGEALLALQASATSPTGAITLQSDASLTIIGAISAPTVRIAPVTNTVGMTVDALRAGTGLALTPADLAQVLSTRLDLGSIDGGVTPIASIIGITAPVSLRSGQANTLGLFARGDITESAAGTLAVNTLLAIAGTPTRPGRLLLGGANAIDQVGPLTAFGSYTLPLPASLPGQIAFNDVNPLSVAGSVTGSTIGIAAPSIVQTFGGMTASAPGTFAQPSVALAAIAGHINQAVATAITVTDPAGLVTMRSDTDVTLGGTVTANGASGRVAIAPYTGGVALQIDPLHAGGGHTSLTPADLAAIVTPLLDLGSVDGGTALLAGSIAVNAPANLLNHAGALGLYTTGAVTEGPTGSADVQVPALTGIASTVTLGSATNVIPTLSGFTIMTNSAGQGFLLNDAAPQVAVAGRVGGAPAPNAAAPLVSITNAGDLVIPGTIQGAQVVLAAGGALTETGALSAGTLTGGAGARASLTGATPVTNQVVALGDFTTPNFLLIDNVPLLGVTGTLQASTVSTIVNTGSVTDTGAIIGGDTSITSVNGSIAIPGKIGAGGAAGLYASHGSIDESGVLGAGWLTGSAGSFAHLNGATTTSNVVQQLGAFVTDNAGLTAPSDFTLYDNVPSLQVAAAVAGGPGITLRNSGNIDIPGSLAAAGVVLTSISGAITETGGITAGTVSGAARTSMRLTGSPGANRIGTLGPLTAQQQDVSVNNTGTLHVAGPVTAGSAASISTSGDLGIPGTITATGVTLGSGADIDAPGTIAAAGLSGSASGHARFGGPNMVGTLQGFAVGDDFVMSDRVGQLTVAGLLKAGPSISLVNTGDIDIPAAIAATALSLVSANGGIVEPGSLHAGTLTGGAATRIGLTGTNTIAALGDVSAPDGVAVRTIGDLTVNGAVDGGTAMTIAVQNGSLSIPGSVSGTVVALTADKDVTETGALTTGTLTGSAGGSARLTGNPRVATIARFAAGSALEVDDGQSVTVTGPLTASDTLTLVVGGDLTQSGRISGFTTTLDATGSLTQRPGAFTEGLGSAFTELSAGTDMSLNGRTDGYHLSALAGRDLTLGGGADGGSTASFRAGRSLTQLAGANTAASAVLALSSGGGMTLAGNTSAASLSANAGGDLAQSGTVSGLLVSMQANGVLTQQAGAVATAGASLVLKGGGGIALAGTTDAPLIAGTTPATLTLTGGSIRTESTPRTGQLRLEQYPASGQGAYFSAAHVRQIGDTTVNAGVGAATVRFDLTDAGSIEFAAAGSGGFRGSGTELFLVLGNGSARGNIDVGALYVAFDPIGGAPQTQLTGTINGLGGSVAAQKGFITAQPNSNYRLNGCSIQSINCVVISTELAPPINPLGDFEIGTQRRREEDADLLLPNVAEQDY